MFVEVTSTGQIALVAALAREIWTEHYTPIIGKEQVAYMLDTFQSEPAIAEQIISGALYYLLQEGSRTVGYLAAQAKGDELFLSKIYVLADVRRNGYGRRSVEFLEQLAREKGCRKITLTVNKNNTGSIRAYERIGFRNIGPVVQEIGAGFVMDDYRMEKPV